MGTRDEEEPADRRTPHAGPFELNPDEVTPTACVDLILATVNLFDCVLGLLSRLIAIGDLRDKPIRLAVPDRERNVYLQCNLPRTSPRSRDR